MFGGYLRKHYFCGTLNGTTKCTSFSLMSIVILSREFRDNQKKYFDLVDKHEQVIVKRNGKAYTIVPMTATEAYFVDPQIKERLKRSIEQAEAGLVVELTPEKQRELLGE